MNQAEAEELIRKAQERIKDANIEIQQARDLLAKPEPWEPDISYENNTVSCSNSKEKKWDRKIQDYGIGFPNHREAQKAFHWFRFYHRLYQLALEFNGEGERNSAVYYSLHRKIWDYTTGNDSTKSVTLFFTKKGAEKAVEIMNRDGWRLPEETP